MPIFEPFAVVRVPFPFTDRAVQRRRPALVLSDLEFQRGSVHVLLAMITTVRRSRRLLDWSIQDLVAAGLNPNLQRSVQAVQPGRAVGARAAWPLGGP